MRNASSDGGDRSFEIPQDLRLREIEPWSTLCVRINLVGVLAR